MRTIKSVGMDDLGRLRRRIQRSHAMNRIGRSDAEYLLSLVNQMEARIVEMRELNEQGEEEG